VPAAADDGEFMFGAKLPPHVVPVDYSAFHAIASLGVGAAGGFEVGVQLRVKRSGQIRHIAGGELGDDGGGARLSGVPG